jgi:nitrite reductase (NO-forming)
MLVVSVLVVSGCGSKQPERQLLSDAGTPDARVAPEADPGARVEFGLRTGIANGRMVYLGVDGDIAGLINPDLVVQAGDTVYLTVINGDEMPHDLVIDVLGIRLGLVSGLGETTEVSFTVRSDWVGTYSYYCSVAGHRQAGMEGRLIIVP